MIVDAHTHLFPAGMDKVGTAELLLGQMDSCGVDRAIILNIYPRVSNEFIAEQWRSHSERLIGFCSVDPNDGAPAVELLDRCVSEYGAKGLKIHPSMQRFEADDVELLTPLMRKVQQLNVPVLLHSWAWWGRDSRDSPKRVMHLAEKFPEVTFIMAHCGGMHFLDLMQGGLALRGKRPENLYADLSGIIFDLAGSPLWEFLRWTVKSFGPDRIMMGSDFPDHSVPETLDLCRSLDLDETSMDLILGGTAARLLNI
jgi:predicted TIM-barrel fold metal-dependent hydrolase